MGAISFKLLVRLKLNKNIKNYEQFNNTIRLIANIQFKLNDENINMISRSAVDIINSLLYMSFANYSTQRKLVACIRDNNLLPIISIKFAL